MDRGSDPIPLSHLLLQITKAVDAGLRFICICLTSDVHRAGQAGFDPWLSPEAPLDNRTKGMLDRVVELHPHVFFVIRFYAQSFSTEFENIVMLKCVGVPTRTPLR
jgi:hypothetical protein